MVWTAEELRAYGTGSPKLDSFYAAHQLADKGPEVRARYLAESFLRLNSTDHEVFMRIACDEGNDVSMGLLEKLTIKQLQE